MIRFVVLAYVAGCLLFARETSAQKWNTHGMVEANAKLGSLPLDDRNGIANQLHISAKNLRVLKFETTSAPVFFVQGYGMELCGATGNCKSWMLANDYKVLLRGYAQTVKLLSTLHNGRPDILTGLHDSAMESDLTQWRFTGSRYVRYRCALIEYEDLTVGRYKVPKVTRQPCQN